MARILRSLLVSTVLALAIAGPVLGRAGASITGPDGAHFGETHGVTFDTGHATRINPFNWWAHVVCFNGATTIEGDVDTDEGEAVYAEWLHLGDQDGYPINDNLMTFGPTPSWAGGGADCSVELRAYDGNGNFVGPYATDEFVVLAD